MPSTNWLGRYRRKLEADKAARQALEARATELQRDNARLIALVEILEYRIDCAEAELSRARARP